MDSPLIRVQENRGRFIRCVAVAAIVVATLLLSPSASGTASAQVVPTYGAPNPGAPPELSQFAFLIGKWQAHGKVLRRDGRGGRWEESSGSVWTQRYILDGHAIAGVYQRQEEDGALKTTFIDFRFYDRHQDRWIVEFVDPIAGSFRSQAQEAVGGVQVSDTSVMVNSGPRDVGGVSYTLRETFLNITEDRFTYRSESSRDGGESWLEIEVKELSRIED